MNTITGEYILQAFSLLNRLEATTKRNEKKDILQEGSDNEAFKQMFYLAYNPFIKFNIIKFKSEPKAKLKSVDAYGQTFSTFKTLLDDLSQRNITGNEAIYAVERFFTDLTPDEAKWYERILKKDLKVGVTAKTFNSVFKKYIPVFECMLAKSWDDVKKKPKEIFVEPKLDGYRALAFVENGEVSIYTRNGKEIKGFTDLEKELAELPNGVYDGELIGKESHFSDMQKYVFRDAENKQAVFNVFDYVGLEHFKRGKYEKPLIERKKLLSDILRDGTENIKVVPYEYYSEYTTEDLMRLHRNWTDMGYEGIMVKDAMSAYECKRSSSWAKVKAFETFDLEVIGFEEGEGRHKGTLGALVVDFNGVKVNVGSGYTDEMRKHIWENKHDYIGKIVEVQAQEVTTNKKGEKSLRFPVFLRFRLDK